ncbi:MAG TPA: valine--tRNA ligase [Ignavibacteria bacterium]|nr:valine--tRNA ligase [Ignavibacteria bacterium]
MKEISKIYNPVEVEERIIAFWQSHNFYTPEDNSKKPKYSIVIPPPNVTGDLTIGHMLDNTVQDIYVRWKRMTGYNVLWLPGTDHAGIATQTKVEAELRKEKISRYDLGREKFVEKVWEWKKVYHANITSQLVRMGASVDWSRERFTMDEGLSHAVKKVFVELYKKGLIYKGKRIINWDPEQQTALSDEEVIYAEKKDKLYYIKYPVLNESGKFITIATTRPETMLGDTAVAVNPNDKRYSSIAGKKVILPIVEKVIPLIADDYVDMEFGTGALKITPAHDPNDFIIGQKYNLETVQVIDHTGKMNENAGNYSGLDRFKARKQIVDKLNELGLIEKIEDYVHNVGESERGGAIVEPYLSDQWFVNMKPLAEPALNAVVSGEIKFHPERWIKVYEHWMKNIRDWCISRQLWWGHQIPVWYNKNTGDIYCEIAPPADTENWEQDPDVLDTWFSSWLWPFSTMGWPDDDKDLKLYYPTDLLSTAPDIIFFWVARMIMASLEFTGRIPFEDVYFHNIIRDVKGRKMSKSLGNSPDVIGVMNEYGGDALRFTIVYLAPIGTDVLFSKEMCEFGRNFANKVWNAARFLMMKEEQAVNKFDDYEHDIFDKWLISRFNTALKTYTDALNDYKINEATKALYDFIWSDYCDWYIEVLKIKAVHQPEAAGKIFDDAIHIFESTLKLLHPVMPFITEEIWHGFNDDKINDSISLTEMPVFNDKMLSPEIENDIAAIQALISSVRNLRSEINLAPSVKCDVVISCNSEKGLKLINSIKEFIIYLARIENADIGLHLKKPLFKSISSVVNDFQVYIKIEGLVDIEKEKVRIKKEIERAEGFLSSVNKKLHNENFLKKATAEVVENEKKKQSDAISRLEKLKVNYNSITN